MSPRIADGIKRVSLRKHAVSVKRTSKKEFEHIHSEVVDMTQAAVHSRSQAKRVAAMKGAKLPVATVPPPVQQNTDAVRDDGKVPYTIHIFVDWENMPLQEARNYYERLSKEYEKAGRILNERATTRQPDQFNCFMAGKPGCCKIGTAHTGRPRFIDLSYKAPKGGYKDLLTNQHTPEGLTVPVNICSELCFHRYNEILIAERRERNNPAVNG